LHLGCLTNMFENSLFGRPGHILFQFPQLLGRAISRARR